MMRVFRAPGPGGASRQGRAAAALARVTISIRSLYERIILDHPAAAVYAEHIVRTQLPCALLAGAISTGAFVLPGLVLL